MKIIRPKSRQPLPEHAKKVFSGVVFDVYQWEQEMFDGSKATFEKIKRKDTVEIIPVTPEGRIIVSYQEQPGKEPFMSVVGGAADDRETVLEAAKRELIEETGYEAEKWELFYSEQPSSKIEWALYVLIAKGCKEKSKTKLDAGEKIKLKFVDFDEFVDVITSEAFNDKELKIKFLEAKINPERMKQLKNILLN